MFKAWIAGVLFLFSSIAFAGDFQSCKLNMVVGETAEEFEGYTGYEVTDGIALEGICPVRVNLPFGTGTVVVNLKRHTRTNCEYIGIMALDTRYNLYCTK